MPFGPGVDLPWLRDEITQRSLAEPTAPALTFHGSVERVNNLIASASGLGLVSERKSARQVLIFTDLDLEPIAPEGTPPPVEFTNLRPAPVVDYNDYFTNPSSPTPTYPPASFTDGGGFPPGVTVTPGGLLTGTPSDNSLVGGTGTVNVVDVQGNPAQQSQDFTRVNLPAIASRGPAPSQTWGLGEVVAYDMSGTFTDEATEGTYNAVSYSGVGLPVGLSVNASTGVVEGTVGGVETTGSATITATDEAGNTADSALPWETVLVLNPIEPKGVVPAQNWTQGVDPGTLAMSDYFTNQADDGTYDPASYALTAGTLYGRNLNTSTGDITGAPNATGEASHEITVTDTNSNQAKQTFNVKTLGAIAAKGSVPAQVWDIDTAVNLDMKVYFTNEVADNTWDPASFSVSPALPTGLSLNTSTGLITGTPSAAQTDSIVTVTATDEQGNTAPQDIDFKVLGAIYNTATVPAQTWTQDQAITNLSIADYVSNDGSIPPSFNPASYADVGGLLPAGVTLDTNTGLISGTPTGTQTATATTIRVTDDSGRTTDQQFNVTVEASTGEADVWFGFGEINLPANTNSFTCTSLIPLPGMPKAVYCFLNTASVTGSSNTVAQFSEGVELAGEGTPFQYGMQNTISGVTLSCTELFTDFVLKQDSGAASNIDMVGEGPVTDGWQFRQVYRATGAVRTVLCLFMGGADLDVNAVAAAAGGAEGTTNPVPIPADRGSGQFDVRGLLAMANSQIASSPIDRTQSSNIVGAQSVQLAQQYSMSATRAIANSTRRSKTGPVVIDNQDESGVYGQQIFENFTPTSFDSRAVNVIDEAPYSIIATLLGFPSAGFRVSVTEFLTPTTDTVDFSVNVGHPVVAALFYGSGTTGDTLETVYSYSRGVWVGDEASCLINSASGVENSQGTLAEYVSQCCLVVKISPPLTSIVRFNTANSSLTSTGFTIAAADLAAVDPTPRRCFAVCFGPPS